MDRPLTTTPQYVLIFEVNDDFIREHGPSPVKLTIPPKIIAAIKDHFESLAPGEKPDLSKFNLPNGLTMRVESLRPDKPSFILALKGEEAHAYRETTKNYVPDALHLPAPWVVEVGERPDRRRLVAATWGAANEMNRDQGRWNYADVSEEQDGSHWSHFTGHHEQVDINVTTYNARETHEWKGKEGVKGRAYWTVALDRVQVGEGWSDTWERAHRAAGNYVRKLQDQIGALSGLTDSWRDAEEKLVGRAVWYREQPAVITSLILDQGCMVVKPAMAEHFTQPAYLGKDDFPDDPHERTSAKVELLSPDIWWWRDNADKDLFPHTREAATA